LIGPAATHLYISGIRPGIVLNWLLLKFGEKVL